MSKNTTYRYDLPYFRSDNTYNHNILEDSDSDEPKSLLQPQPQPPTQEELASADPTTAAAATATTPVSYESQPVNKQNNRNAMLILFSTVVINLVMSVSSLLFPSAANVVNQQEWVVPVFILVSIIITAVFLALAKEKSIVGALVCLYLLIIAYCPSLFGLAYFGPEFWVQIFAGLASVPLFAALAFHFAPDFDNTLIFAFSTLVSLILNFLLPLAPRLSWTAAGYSVIGILGNGVLLAIENEVAGRLYDKDDVLTLAINPYYHIMFPIAMFLFVIGQCLRILSLCFGH